MQYQNLANFLSRASSKRELKGPIALVLIEDRAAVMETLEHCRKIGFSKIIAFGKPELFPETVGGDDVEFVDHDIASQTALTDIVNGMIAAFPGQWMHYCYNAEFLYFPFCEERTIGEMIAFSVEERRDACVTFVVDLYAEELSSYPNGVSIESAHFDSAGYYSLVRKTEDGEELDRQLDFFGGLRWRYEEHVPWRRRRIDRIGVFKAVKGLELFEDHRFNLAEYNTYACPWHNNITAAICSFRTAKALRRNPGSMHAIQSFHWEKSEKFSWKSNQLMELGLMEPGQWF